MARRWIIVPAAGGGTRFGSAKQYVDVAGQPLLARTLARLASLEAEATVVALAPDDQRFAQVVSAPAGVETLACGGATRAQTVRNALRALAARCRDDDWILVHDAARCCVPRDALVRLVDELRDDPVGGLLALPLADTLKRATTGEDAPRIARTEPRAGLWLAQTPQMFRYRLLCDAYASETSRDCTDDAQAVEALAATGRCTMPRLVTGSAQNIKVTYPADLALAAAIIAIQERS
jgi:2-C-methyl-D-erythritol 4-phosphate cytidylyltransferase